MTLSLLEHSDLALIPKRLREPFAWVEHIPFAFHLVKLCKPKIYVELGVHIGNSFCAFCQAVAREKLSTQCFGIDNWTGDEHAGFYPESIYLDLKEYIDQEYSSFASLLRKSFDEGLADFADGSIDLLHVDGLHTYEAVKRDFETWLPKLSSRAVVLFHDTAVYAHDFGVWKLWEELSSQYPSFNFIHGFGLGVLAVGVETSPGVMEFLRLANSEPKVQEIFSQLGSSITARGQLRASERKVEELEKEYRELGEEFLVLQDQLTEAELQDAYRAEFRLEGADDEITQGVSLDVKGTEQELRFAMDSSPSSRFRLASFSPFAGPVAVRLAYVDVEEASGRIHRIDRFASNHFHFENDTYFFDSAQPKFSFPLHHIEAPVFFRVKLLYMAFGGRVFKLLFRRLLESLEAANLGVGRENEQLVISDRDSASKLPPREKKNYDPKMLEATLFLHEEFRKKEQLLSEQQQFIEVLETNIKAFNEQAKNFSETERRYLQIIEDRDRAFRTLESFAENQRLIIADRDKHFQTLESYLKGITEAYEQRLAEMQAKVHEREEQLELLKASQEPPEGETWRKLFQRVKTAGQQKTND